MAHGQPDFGLYASKSTIYPVVDVGELAARLGSVVTFDRRGDVILIDDFDSSTLKWSTHEEGVSASVEISAITARYGSQSVRITPGYALDDFSTISRYFPIIVPSKIGIEFSFATIALAHEFRLKGYFYNTPVKHEFMAKWVQSDSSIQIYDAVAEWVTIGTKALVGSDHAFNSMKLVVDYNTKKYVRLLFNDSAYDLSAYSLEESGTPTSPCIFVEYRVTNTLGAGGARVFVDDFILTQNEP